MRNKIIVNKREKYDGSFDGLKRIVNQYLVPKFTDIKFYLKESVTTNSYYVFLNKGNQSIAIRFSDHKPVKNILSYTLSAMDKSRAVVAAIVHNINRLNRKYLYSNLEKIGGDKC